MIRKLTSFLLFFILTCPMYAQAIWEGPKITFSKPDNADPALEENQDRITDNVWITRGTTMGIYNIKTEDGYTVNSSPEGTEWAFGTTEELSNLTFDNWQTTVNNNPPEMVNRDMVLHLIEEDIYINLKFLSWTAGGGGGFSYERSTSLSSAIRANEEFSGRISVFPNPGPPERVRASYQSASPGTLRVSVYGLSGKLHSEETLAVQPGPNNWKLNLSGCDSGIYLLKFRQGSKLAARRIVLR